ncbi:MAG: hypothetical protein ACRDPR_24160 [Nocardioidaceae bacterium]
MVIAGSNFGCDGCVHGVNSVRFEGTSADFVIDSDVRITATVPAGATTGRIRVQSTGGATLSPDIFMVP